ncbi:MAG: TIGR00266 family protein [Myxococcota bacterium]
MKHEIIDSPDFGMLRVDFDASGETVVCEAGAMVAMSADVQMKTSMRGGLMAAAKRKLLGGESIFQNTFTATGPGQNVYIAPPPEGDIRTRTLEAGEEFYLQSGAYLAHVGDQMVLDTKWGGMKSFFGGVGFFMLKVVGPGELYYTSYGAIHEVDINGSYTCDTGHIVGFSTGLTYNIRKFGGFKGLFFSGEGLICEFSGTGKLYLQTRNAGALAAFLHPFRPVKNKS